MSIMKKILIGIGIISGIIAILLIVFVVSFIRYEAKNIGYLAKESVKRSGYTMTEEKKEMVLKHMQEKYGEEFVGITAGGPSWDREYDLFRIYPKRLGKEHLVYVCGEYDENNDYYLQDSYFSILIQDRYQEYIEKMIKELYPNCYVSTKVANEERVYSDRFTKDMPIEEIFSPEDKFVYYNVDIYVAFPESAIKKVSVLERNNAIIQKMYENNLAVGLRIAVIRDQKFKDYVEKKGEIYLPEDYPDVTEEYLRETANKDYFVPLQPKNYEVTGKSQYNYQSYGSVWANEETNWQLKIY